MRIDAGTDTWFGGSCLFFGGFRTVHCGLLWNSVMSSGWRLAQVDFHLFSPAQMGPIVASMVEVLLVYNLFSISKFVLGFLFIRISTSIPFS